MLGENENLGAEKEEWIIGKIESLSKVQPDKEGILILIYIYIYIHIHKYIYIKACYYSVMFDNGRLLDMHENLLFKNDGNNQSGEEKINN